MTFAPVTFIRQSASLPIHSIARVMLDSLGVQPMPGYLPIALLSVKVVHRLCEDLSKNSNVTVVAEFDISFWQEQGNSVQCSMFNVSQY